MTGPELTQLLKGRGKMKDIAEALGVKPPVLSMYRNGKRSIPEEFAEKVREFAETGNPVTESCEDNLLYEGKAGQFCETGKVTYGDYERLLDENEALRKKLKAKPLTGPENENEVLLKKIGDLRLENDQLRAKIRQLEAQMRDGIPKTTPPPQAMGNPARPGSLRDNLTPPPKSSLKGFGREHFGKETRP